MGNATGKAVATLFVAWMAWACSAKDGGVQQRGVLPGNPGGEQPPLDIGAGAGGSSVAGASGGASGAGAGAPIAGTSGAGGSPGAAGVSPGAPSAGAGGTSAAGAGGGGAMSTAGAGGASDPMPPSDGPVDGDPSRPMVEVPGVPCGPPQVGFNSNPPTVQIGGRDVVVAYPCAHEGAAVTFFLFLHGTLQEAQKVPFTMGAFPIHEMVDSDNVIVVVPKAIGTQWGNGDNGEDLPHLYEVVDWVYETFGDRFDVRSMWASGGSWGAFYLNRTFACDPRFEGRLRGVRMVVGGGCPRCSDRLSCIVAQQELELGMGAPLTPEQQEMRSSGASIDTYAQMHGCDPKTGPVSLGPVRHWTWANCDPGWVHSYYLGAGAHADRWDDPTALRAMVDELKSIE